MLAIKISPKLPVLIFLTLALSGCAAHYTVESIQYPYGFFSGLWHGMIASLTIMVNIISWLLSFFGVDFFRDVQIIGRPNTGFFYYVGFGMGWLWIPIFR